MASLALTGLVLTLAASVSGQISAVSWGPGRGDVFGAYQSRLFHKFYTGSEWQPATAEFLAGATSSDEEISSDPTALGWDGNRLDVFYTGTNASVYQRFWDGSSWQPDDLPKGLGQNLGSPPGGAVGAIGADNVGEWINLAAKGPNGGYYQKFYKPSAKDWRPRGAEWEWLGGKMAGSPAVQVVGDQVHYFGISNGTRQVHHKFWDGTRWMPSPKGWETLGGGPFAGEVTVTNWGPDRFDIWAVGQDGALYHRYFQTGRYSDWESLGGTGLTGKPQVASQRPGKFDIIVPKAADDGFTYAYKAYDGERWWPEADGFYDLSGSFSGAPGIVSWSDTTVALFGVTKPNDELVFRFWWGGGWFPEDGSWALLANLKTAASENGFAGKWEGLLAQELR